ncbi:MAG: tetratricopeptide repeat protein [Candidatus Obscuribacterales bacterium]|nr:tetratricopeptide repeat protein [Candidatus Obscuribacterales bacterium]
MIDRKYKSIMATATVLLLAVAAFYAPEALSKSKVDWDKKLAKGFRDLEIGDYDKAMLFFQSEVDHHPECGPARMGLGLAFKKKGKPGEAIAAIRRATEVDPDYAQAHYELGALLESNKDYAEALKSFERYLQLDPLSSKKASVEDRIRNCKQNI